MDHERWLDGLSDPDYQKIFRQEQQVQWQEQYAELLYQFTNRFGQEVVVPEFSRCFRW